MGQDCSRSDNAEDGGGGGGNRRRTTKSGKNYAAGDGEDKDSGGGGSGANMQKAARRALRRPSDDDDVTKYPLLNVSPFPSMTTSTTTPAAALTTAADALAVSEGGSNGSTTNGGGLQSLSHTSNPLRNFTSGPPGTATTTFTMMVQVGSGAKPNMPVSSPTSTATPLPPPAPISSKFREYHSPTFGGAATEGFISCVSAEGILPSGCAADPKNKNSISLSLPKKGMVLCAGEDKNIYYCNYETGHVIKTFRKAHSRDVKILTRPVGGTFFSGGRDGLIKQWSLDGSSSSSPAVAAGSDEPIVTYTGHSLIVTALTPLFRDGTTSTADSSSESGISNKKKSDGGWCGATRLVSGSRDNTVRLWDIATGKCLSSVDVKLNLVHFLHEVGGVGGSFAAGLVAQGGEDLTVRLWDTRLDNHNSLSLVSTMANFDYHPLCATSRGDTPTFPFPSAPAAQGMYGAASSTPSTMASHNHLYTGHNGFNGKGSMILEWDLRMQRSTRKFLGHTMSVRCMCFARLALPLEDQTTSETFLGGVEITVLVTASDDGTIKLWNVDSPSSGLPITHTTTGTSTPQSTPNQKQYIASIAIPEGKVNSIDQSAVSGRLILGMQSGSIIVLDAVQALSIRARHPTQGQSDEDTTYDVDVAVGSRFRYFGRPNPHVC